MQKIAEDTRLPIDIDAQPLVQAAAALRPVIRYYHEEIEREQCLPQALVEQLHAVGFYSLDGGQPRRSPDGTSVYWRGVFPRAEAQIVEGSWDVAGLRGTGSFDWTVEDVFLPERRTMAQSGAPLDNQWRRWPGVAYALPTQAWVGPHHSAVITGIARAGIDALIQLAGGKTPRGRTGLLCENPQVQDAVGRADATLNAGRVYRNAMIAEIWNTVAGGHDTTLDQRARCRLAAADAAANAGEATDRKRSSIAGLVTSQGLT